MKTATAHRLAPGAGRRANPGCRGASRQTLNGQPRPRDRRVYAGFDPPAYGPLDGKDGGEEDMGGYEQGFELDAAAVVSRVMTSKAVQHILIQLGQTNLVTCQYLHNFAAENPPIAGDDFVSKLMDQVRGVH